MGENIGHPSQENLESEKSLGELLKEEQEYRENEDIEVLYRYISLAELLSYFGEGKTLEERIATGLKSKDILQLFGGSLYKPEKSDIDSLRKDVKVEIPKEDIENLGLTPEEIEEKIGGILKKYRPILIGPTIRGFGVNEPAGNYRSHFILEVRLEDKIKVKDLLGDKKTVPFEPTYISTPPILVYELNNRRGKEEFILEAYGRLLTKENVAVINQALTSEISYKDLAHLLKEKVFHREDKVLGDFRKGIVNYLYKEKEFKNDNEKDDYFDGLDEELNRLWEIEN